MEYVSSDRHRLVWFWDVGFCNGESSGNLACRLRVHDALKPESVKPAEGGVYETTGEIWIVGQVTCYVLWTFRKSALSLCKLIQTENQEHHLQPEVTGFSELPTIFLKNIVFNAKYSQTRSAISTNWWQIDTIEKEL